MVRLFKKLLDKSRTGQLPSSSEVAVNHYFFVSSSNASLIHALHALFTKQAYAYNGTAGHYSVSRETCEEEKQKAVNQNLLFPGCYYSHPHSILDPLVCSSVSYMHEVWRSIGSGMIDRKHIAYVSVNSKGISVIQ